MAISNVQRASNSFAAAVAQGVHSAGRWLTALADLHFSDRGLRGDCADDDVIAFELADLDEAPLVSSKGGAAAARGGGGRCGGAMCGWLCCLDPSDVAAGGCVTAAGPVAEGRRNGGGGAGAAAGLPESVFGSGSFLGVDDVVSGAYGTSDFDDDFRGPLQESAAATGATSSRGGGGTSGGSPPCAVTGGHHSHHGHHALVNPFLTPPAATTKMFGSAATAGGSGTRNGGATSEPSWRFLTSGTRSPAALFASALSARVGGARGVSLEAPAAPPLAPVPSHSLPGPLDVCSFDLP